VTAAPQSEDDGLLVASVAACRVLGLDGSVSRLRDVWGTKPVVHVFLRQFGCLFCHEMVGSLIERVPDIQQLGAHVVMVGCGNTEQAVRFARDKRLPRFGIAIFTDPSRASFEAANLERGWGKVFLDGEAREAYRRARREGHRITGVQGDVPQLGGLMVVQPPARLTFIHRSRFAGDHPEPSEILDALR
jgi:hypothetical protein